MMITMRSQLLKRIKAKEMGDDGESGRRLYSRWVGRGGRKERKDGLWLVEQQVVKQSVGSGPTHPMRHTADVCVCVHHSIQWRCSKKNKAKRGGKVVMMIIINLAGWLTRRKRKQNGWEWQWQRQREWDHVSDVGGEGEHRHRHRHQHLHEIALQRPLEMPCTWEGGRDPFNRKFMSLSLALTPLFLFKCPNVYVSTFSLVHLKIEPICQIPPCIPIK